MKIKTVLLSLIMAAIILLLFAPIPSVGVKLLYLLDVIYGMVILGFGIYAAAKKQIPQALPRILLYFTVYTLVLNVAAVRYLFMFKIQSEEIPLVSKLAEDVIISSPIAGYILFSVGVFVSFYSVLRNKAIGDVDLTGSIKLLKGTIKLMILLFFVSIVGCWALGFSKLELNYIEAFTFYIPYICTHFMLKLIPFLMAGVGLDLLKLVKRASK